MGWVGEYWCSGRSWRVRLVGLGRLDAGPSGMYNIALGSRDAGGSLRVMGFERLETSSSMLFNLIFCFITISSVLLVRRDASYAAIGTARSRYPNAAVIHSHISIRLLGAHRHDSTLFC